jgi:hypothetical protein
VLPDVVRDEMQICVAYLVVVKREEEEEEEEVFFVSGFQESSLQIQKKNIYRLHERRAFDLSRPRALRAPGSEYFLHQSLASTASFSKRVTVLKFLVIIAGKNSRERQKRRDTKKQREKNLSLSLSRERF